ncbi:MAG TPA: 50S ribosomal protein L3 [Phycisphaerales bacterium]|nr:50S ribosomal protein L3 [Phycisphaerales bacterium]
MAFTLLGTKLGMTRVYTPEGVSVPVTAVKLGPCVVTQVKTVEKDGYCAVQIGFGEIKPRRSTQSVIMHDAKAGTTPKRYHREFRCTAEEAGKYTVGQTLTARDFEGTMFVDVTGTSKGKGFQGTMKRWHFKGMFATHGTERKHRSPGSIGSLCSNRGFGGGLKKGKKMSGQMGNARITQRSLDIMRILPEQDLILVKGPVPGPASGMVMVRTATRLYKSKAKKVAAAKK